MILEVAVLNIRPGQSDAFEQAFAQAQSIIAAMPGYIAQLPMSCNDALRCRTNISCW